jgi:hypothetical protein
MSSRELSTDPTELGVDGVPADDRASVVADSSSGP